MTELICKDIELDAIIYALSLTNEIDNQYKIFQFLESLSLKPEQKRTILIPLLTKYDNFIFDSKNPLKELSKIQISKIQQIKSIFKKYNYEEAWYRRIQWTNQIQQMDSLKLKMQLCASIKDKYHIQLNKLIKNIKIVRKPFSNQQLSDKQFKDYILQDLSDLKDFKKYFISSSKQQNKAEIQLSFVIKQDGLKKYEKTNNNFLTNIYEWFPKFQQLLKTKYEDNNFKISKLNLNDQIYQSEGQKCLLAIIQHEWSKIKSILKFYISNSVLNCILPQQKFIFFDFSKTTLSDKEKFFTKNTKINNLFELDLSLDSLKFTTKITLFYTKINYEKQKIIAKIYQLRKKFNKQRFNKQRQKYRNYNYWTSSD